MSNARRHRISFLLCALALAGCGGNAMNEHSGKAPTVPRGATNKPAPPDSVQQNGSPEPRTGDLIDALNAYRKSTFGRSEDVASSDVLYTAAFRHANYLNSINSAGWEKVPPEGGNPPEQTAINPNSKYFELFEEEVVPASETATFPCMYTNTDPFDRIEAVSGGHDFLASIGATRAETYEMAVFNGSVWRKDGTISEFRGFNLDTRRVDDPDKYEFNAIDNLWYSRRGRAVLSRAALRYVGYAAVDDENSQTPPYPILLGRMKGILKAVSSRPLTGQFGFWPNADNVGAKAVTAYGTDTDLNGPNQFAGTVIHMSLPVAEPIRRDTGVVVCSFKRVDDVVTRPNTWRWFAVYSNVEGMVVPSAAGAFDDYIYKARGLPPPVVIDAVVTNVTVLTATTPFVTRVALDPSVVFDNVNVGDTLRIKIRFGTRAGTYQFTILGVDVNSHTVIVSIPWEMTPETYANDLTNVKVDIISATATGVTALVDPNLRDGEFMIVPIAPLEPNARYEVQLHLRTASYDTGLWTWQFETNDKTNEF